MHQHLSSRLARIAAASVIVAGTVGIAMAANAGSLDGSSAGLGSVTDSLGASSGPVGQLGGVVDNAVDGLTHHVEYHETNPNPVVGGVSDLVDNSIVDSVVGNGDMHENHRVMDEVGPTDEAVPPGAINGDPGNALDAVTDLVQNLAPGVPGEQSGIDLAPINLEIPGVLDVAADADLLTPGHGLLGLVAVPCLGVGLFGESAECPAPGAEVCEGQFLNIPLDPTISGLLDGALHLSADDCGIHLCLNLGLLGILEPDCPEPAGEPPTTTPTTENPPVTNATVPTTPESPTTPGDGGGGATTPGGTLPFTGGGVALAGLGSALLAGGHLVRRLTSRVH